MKTNLVAGFLLCCAVALAQQPPAYKAASREVAGDPATREQVMEFLQVMDMRKQFDALVSVMQQQFRDSASHIREQYPDMDDEDALFVASEQERLTTGIFKRLDIPRMEEGLIPIYQHHFTRPEMTAILVFYESPAGQKMRTELPALMAEMMPVMMAQMQPVLDDLTREMRQRTEDHFKAKKARQAQSPQ